MQLKNHLNFLGDRNKQEITFHLSGAFNPVHLTRTLSLESMILTKSGVI